MTRDSLHQRRPHAPPAGSTDQPPIPRMDTSAALVSVQPLKDSPSGLSVHARATASATPSASPVRARFAADSPSLVARQGRSMPSLATRRRSQPLQYVSLVPEMKPTFLVGSWRATR